MGDSNTLVMPVPLATTGDKEIDFNHPAAAHVEILDHATAKIDWKGRKKLAIVGFASSCRALAPYDDPDWIIIGLNQLYRIIPRADAWFDIHWNADHPDAIVEGTDYTGWLRASPIPVYMINHREDIPNSVPYPVEDIIKKPWGVDYFTSTISYGIALAIREGFTTIGLWGIDLIVGTEYDYQKSCAEFWLGTANGLGIDIVLPVQSALLKQSHRYGYEKEPNYGLIKMSMLKERVTEITAEKSKRIVGLHNIDGSLAELEWWLSQVKDGKIGEYKEGQFLSALEARKLELLKQKNSLLLDVHVLDGAHQESDRWLQLYDLRMKGCVLEK